MGIDERAAEVRAQVRYAGEHFGVRTRVPAVGGQVVSIDSDRATYPDLFLPLYGAHQAENAALALAAVEALVAGAPGRLAGVVNAAGVAGGGLSHQVPLEEWQRVIAVNLTGTFLVAKHCAARMLANDRVDGERGSIVTIASIEGIEGTAGGSSYNASKGGVVLLTRNLAIDYGPSGIRANAICPGFIDTPFVASAMGNPARRKEVEAAVGKVGQPEQIARTIAWLVSPESDFVHGETVIADGGVLMR